MCHLNIMTKYSLPLPTLLPDSARKSSRNLAPVLGTAFIDHLNESGVLFFSPGTFDHGRVEDFLPSVETLNVRAVIEE